MSKKSLNIQKKYFKIIISVEILIVFIIGVLLSQYMGYILGLGISLLTVISLYFPTKMIYKKEKVSLSYFSVLNGFVGSGGISFLIWFLLSSQLNASFSVVSFFLILLIAGFLTPILSFVNSVSLKNFGKSLEKDSKIIVYYIPFFVFFVFLFYFQPLDIFLNNTEEISFSIFDALYSLLFFIPFFLVFLYILSCIPEILFKILSVFTASLSVCAYIQMMFFNKYVIQILGADYDWREHTLYSVLSGLLWLGIITFSLVLLKNKKVNYIFIFLNVSIIVLLSSSLIYLFVSAPKDSITKRADKYYYYLDGSDQFTIGSEENVVFLIADAVDNRFIKELLESEPAFFEDFNDFTLYTDTCSVYDLTSSSVPQMLYGYTWKEGTDKVQPFMSRFTDNGYRFLLFSNKALNSAGDPEKYTSNLVWVDDISSNLRLRKDLIRKNFIKVSLYQLLPCMLKKLSKVSDVEFQLCLEFTGDNVVTDFIFDNYDFNRELNLIYNNYSSKCFIYQHINGAHLPCDDYLLETKFCLNIFKKYIYQMKELGVYDDSVIIIAADHGIHDGMEEFKYPTAATPMFMIKGKNVKHDSMVIDDKPFYYMDIQATVLDYSGLYLPEDADLFGKSIDDYGYGPRERVWFDADPVVSEIRKYTYTGNTEELERVVNEGIYEKVSDFSYEFEAE